MTNVIGLYGAGGFGREIMPVLQSQCNTDDTIYFVETDILHERQENGISVISHQTFLKIAGEKHFNIAISNSRLRQSIATECLKHNMTPCPIFAKSVENHGFNDLGQGAIISGFCTIGPNARIGQFFHSEYYSYIAHDCIIGDFVTFAPRVNCNGNVHIGNHAYIGTGAVLKQGAPGKPLTIGECAVVGMGAVVTRDVPPGLTVVGNPARPLPAS